MSRGRACIGWLRSSVKKLLPSDVKMSGAVSPMARDMPRRIPVTIPDKPIGTKTDRTALQRARPRARAPSAIGLGVSRRISSADTVTTGSITIARASDPARPEKWPCVTTTVAYTKMPTTIDGRPARTSIRNRAARARLPPTSIAKMATPSPIGTAIREARPVISSVPISALRTPPPAALRSAGGSFVRKSRLSRLPIPFTNTYPKTAMSGIKERTRATTARITNRFALRRRAPLVGTNTASTSEATAHTSREAIADADRSRVDDHGHDQEHRAQGNQRFGVERLSRLIELVGDDAGQRESGRKDRLADRVGVADHHRDRDRLADRPAQSHDHGRQETCPADRQRDGPGDVPAGAAQRQHGFTLETWCRREDLTAYRRDDRHDHDRQDHAGSEVAGSGRGWAKEWDHPSKGGGDALLQWPQRGHQNKESPQSVDDRGHGRQEIDRDSERSAQSRRRKFRQEQGNQNRDGDRDQQGEQACQERAVDECPGSVDAERGGPRRSSDEPDDPELLVHRGSADEAVDHHHAEDRGDSQCDRREDRAEHQVTGPPPTAQADEVHSTWLLRHLCRSSHLRSTFRELKQCLRCVSSSQALPQSSTRGAGAHPPS